MRILRLIFLPIRSYLIRYAMFMGLGQHVPIKLLRHQVLMHDRRAGDLTEETIARFDCGGQPVCCGRRFAHERTANLKRLSAIRSVGVCVARSTRAGTAH